jgi:hypothetical protein
MNSVQGVGGPGSFRQCRGGLGVVEGGAQRGHVVGDPVSGGLAEHRRQSSVCPLRC